MFLIRTPLAQADPGPIWNQGDVPSMVLVADFASNRGLEGLYWNDQAPRELEAISFAGFSALGMVPYVSGSSAALLNALELNGDQYTVW